GDLEGKYNVPFLEGLSTTLRGGYDVARANRNTFVPTTLGSQRFTSDPGSFAETDRNQTSTVVDAFGNYRHSLGGLGTDIDVTAGYSYEQSRSDFPSFFAVGLSTNVLGPNGIPSNN